MTAGEYLTYYSTRDVHITDASKQSMATMGSAGSFTTTNPWTSGAYPYTSGPYTSGYDSYRTPEISAESLNLKLKLEEVIVSTKFKILYLHKKGLSISEEVSTLHTFYKGRGYEIVFMEDLVEQYTNKEHGTEGIMNQLKKSNAAAYSGFSQKQLEDTLQALVDYKTEVKKAGK